MSEAEQPKRGRGRPRVNPIEGNRRNVTLQVALDLYEELKSASDNSGLSISREMETRLIQSFKPEEIARKAVDDAIFEHDEQTVAESGGKIGFSLVNIYRYYMKGIIEEAIVEHNIKNAEGITEQFVDFVFARIAETTPQIKKMWRGRIVMAKVAEINWNDPEVQAALNKELEGNEELRAKLAVFLRGGA